MSDKISSVIESLTLSTPTFHDVSFTPAYINFIYGKNGTGKTSIANEIRENRGLSWAEGVSSSDYEVRVFDRLFIERNIQQHGNLPGVFTISEQDAETQKEISIKTERKRECDQLATKCDLLQKEKSEELARQKNSFYRQFWDKTKNVRNEFSGAMTGLKTMAGFA